MPIGQRGGEAAPDWRRRAAAVPPPAPGWEESTWVAEVSGRFSRPGSGWLCELGHSWTRVEGSEKGNIAAVGAGRFQAE